MYSRPIRVYRGLLVPLLGLLIVAATGCGGNATVTGKVSYQGKALSSGTIQFQDSDNLVTATEIGKDGTYTVKLRTGEAKVGVSVIDNEMAAKMGAMIKAGRDKKGGFGEKPKIPEGMKKGATLQVLPVKYANPETSGLKMTVKSGSNTQDFDLK
jgi:hypothetical protein